MSSSRSATSSPSRRPAYNAVAHTARSSSGTASTDGRRRPRREHDPQDAHAAPCDLPARARARRGRRQSRRRRRASVGSGPARPDRIPCRGRGAPVGEVLHAEPGELGQAGTAKLRQHAEVHRRLVAAEGARLVPVTGAVADAPVERALAPDLPDLLERGRARRTHRAATKRDERLDPTPLPRRTCETSCGCASARLPHLFLRPRFLVSSREDA
jgi:hypothetical protein